MSDDIPCNDLELVRRAVVHPTNRLAGDMPRWAVVKVVFCTGSTVARELCRRFNVNPDDMVKGIKPDDESYEQGLADGRASMSAMERKS